MLISNPIVENILYAQTPQHFPNIKKDSNNLTISKITQLHKTEKISLYLFKKVSFSTF